MKLLLDSSFLIAYILPNDTLHERAVEIEEDLNICDMQCFVTNQIIAEVVNTLGRRDSAELAKNAYNMMKDSFTCINEYEIPNFNDITIKRYKQLNMKNGKLDIKHKIGFTDCSLIEAAKYYALDAIVTFDSGFLNNSNLKIIS